MGYQKVSGTWNTVSKYYVKESGAWDEITEQAFLSISTGNVLTFGGVIESDDHTLTIIGPANISGETVTLTAVRDSVTDVTSGATWSVTAGGSYATIANNGTLTILSGANGSTVTVSATYGSATATLTMAVTYKSGTSSETTVITDDSGNTTITTTTENSDGSSTSTSTHYDENGNETGRENENTDTSGNTSTQTVTKDGNGNDVVTGYEIDTSGNENGGMVVSGGVDTGVIVFDGHDWTATLKAKILFNDITPASTQFPIMNVSSRGDDNKLDGAFFLVTRQTSGMGSSVYNESGTQLSTTTSNSPTLKWRIQNYLGGSLQNGVDFYYKNGTRPYYTNRFGSKTTALTLTYKMVYTESNHQLVTEIYDADGTTILAKPRSEAVVTFTRTMSDITFEIGKATNVSGTELLTKLEVLDFHVEKTL